VAALPGAAPGLERGYRVFLELRRQWRKDIGS
jgi:hypothetical protein